MSKPQAKPRRVFSVLEKIGRIAKFLYYKVLRIPATPEVIARGLALGVFIGFLPLIPIQTACAVGLALLFRGSKIAAAAGTWVSNPLNFAPLYFAYYYMGVRILPFKPDFVNADKFDISCIFSTNHELFHVMMVGGLVMAVPSAIATYFISVRMIRLYQKKRKERLKNRELQRIKAFQEKMKHDAENTKSQDATSVANKIH